MGVASKHADALLEHVIIPMGGIDNFAEIGIWKGHFCRKILRTGGKYIRNFYFAIDQWAHLGPEHGRMGKVTEEDWKTLYMRSCLDMTYWKQLRTLRLSSLDASSLFPDEYFDVVFIDASHFYEDVLNDIKLWLPKVKKTGYLTGHDINSKKHPGVTKAVEEVFGKDYISIMDRACIWIKKL